MQISEEMKKDHRSFAIIMRGHPDDFALLCKQAKGAGLYIVFTKTSHMKLLIEEVPF